MTTLRVAFLGDIVGKAGRRAFAHALPILRQQHAADIIIANAENVRHGRGLHDAGYRELMNAPAGGPDALTLGDHALDDTSVLPILADPAARLARPWHMDGFNDTHKRFTLAPISQRSPLAGRASKLPPIAVVTVLCRVFMTRDVPDPFQQTDDAVAHITRHHNDALIILETHGEATSEKNALAHHAATTHPNRIIAVLGTHTHVPTNDARIIGPDGATADAGTAALTDLGMCGATNGVIGFNPTESTARLRTGRGQFHPLEGPALATGALIDINTTSRAATRITPIKIPDHD